MSSPEPYRTPALRLSSLTGALFAVIRSRPDAIRELRARAEHCPGLADGIAAITSAADTIRVDLATASPDDLGTAIFIGLGDAPAAPDRRCRCGGRLPLKSKRRASRT